MEDYSELYPLLALYFKCCVGASEVTNFIIRGGHKMSKRIFGPLLAFVAIMALSLTAFAYEVETDYDDYGYEDDADGVLDELNGMIVGLGFEFGALEHNYLEFDTAEEAAEFFNALAALLSNDLFFSIIDHESFLPSEFLRLAQVIIPLSQSTWIYRYYVIEDDYEYVATNVVLGRTPFVFRFGDEFLTPREPRSGVELYAINNATAVAPLSSDADVTLAFGYVLHPSRTTNAHWQPASNRIFLGDTLAYQPIAPVSNLGISAISVASPEFANLTWLRGDDTRVLITYSSQHETHFSIEFHGILETRVSIGGDLIELRSSHVWTIDLHTQHTGSTSAWQVYGYKQAQ